MPKIDIPTSALLLLHCQNDIVKPEGKFAPSGIAEQVERHGLFQKWVALLRASRSAGLRVFYVNNVFNPGHPELGEKPFPLMQGTKQFNAFLKHTWGVQNPDEITPASGEIIIENYNSSAFSATNLDLILRANKIQNLLLAGVATTFVINSTARYGAELGYNIIVIEDGCTAFTDEIHDFEIKNVMPHFATISNTAEVISALGK